MLHGLYIGEEVGAQNFIFLYQVAADGDKRYLVYTIGVGWTRRNSQYKC